VGGGGGPGGGGEAWGAFRSRSSSRISPSHGLNRPRLRAPLRGVRREGEAGSPRKSSIGPVRGRTAWIAGALGAAGVAYRALRRRPRSTADPRADELRRKLDESKPLVGEREQFESGETAVDEAEPATLEEKRDAVRERGQAAAREMRGEKG